MSVNHMLIIGPVTYNGLSVNNDYFVWETFPEVLQKAGISWKIY